jgi:hypothetical protein
VVGLGTGSPIKDANRLHVMQAPVQGNVYPVDLRTVYPTLRPRALEVIDTTDERLETREALGPIGECLYGIQFR